MDVSIPPTVVSDCDLLIALINATVRGERVPAER